MATQTDSGRTQQYWRKNQRLIAILLGIWILVTFVPSYFASDLSEVLVFGWPFPFWAAAFGAPTAFLCLIGVYAWRMDRLDQQVRAEREADAKRESR